MRLVGTYAIPHFFALMLNVFLEELLNVLIPRFTEERAS